MKKALIAIFCVIALAFSVSAVVPSQLDYVDIGDETSEAGHGINGWSALWDGIGSYGCADAGNLGGSTFRTIIPEGAGCMQDDKVAYFSMSTNGTASEIRVRHLVGSQGDPYKLYYESATGWVELTSPTQLDANTCGDGTWYTDAYVLPDLTGTINFKLVAQIDSIPSWCSDWGLNAFSWAQLNGDDTVVPEFSAIAAGIALAGAATGFILLRKRK